MLSSLFFSTVVPDRITRPNMTAISGIQIDTLSSAEVADIPKRPKPNIDTGGEITLSGTEGPRSGSSGLEPAAHRPTKRLGAAG